MSPVGDPAPAASATAWERVASLSALAEGDVVAARVAGRRIAVVRTGGEVHVVDDLCPHARALLSGGFVEGWLIECPLHQARFDVRTGACQGGPTTKAVATHAVRVEGDDILVAVPAAGGT